PPPTQLPPLPTRRSSDLAAFDGGRHGRPVVEARQVPYTHGVTHPELEPEKVLKRAREARPPRGRRHARQFRAVHEDAPLGRLIQDRKSTRLNSSHQITSY